MSGPSEQGESGEPGEPRESAGPGESGVPPSRGDVPADPPGVAPAAVPRLAAGARLQNDKLTGHPILLFPEGMLQLNETGAAILELCDGRRSFEGIVAALAKRFDAPPDMLRGDVAAYLIRLRERRFIEWAAPAGRA